MTPEAFRRHLHRHPELSFLEHDTQRFIAERLDALGIEYRPVAGTGLLARIEGRGGSGDAVVLRADIDALPIRETAHVAWRSENREVMHACGHDVHAAVLYGVLQRMAASPDFRGTLFGLFQPGEECNPGGASSVLAEDPFAGYDVKAVVGQHVEPQLEVGVLGFRAGQYMAANDELRFTVRGRGGHAALRAQVDDTVSAAADLTLRLTALNGPGRVVSVGRIEAPGATNVIPDQVRMEGTMRTFDKALREQTRALVCDLAGQVARQYGLAVVPDITPGYPCVCNDEGLTLRATDLADQLGIPWEPLEQRTTAEDFGYYGQLYPALFYRLGVGAAAGKPHTSDFNPDERAIGFGIGFMHELALNLLTT